jgi:hypothetical protein
MDVLENRENQTLNSKEQIDFIYINAEVGSVFDSQVIALLRFYSNNNWFRSVSLLCGIASESEKNHVIRACADFNIQLLFFKRRPNYFFFHFFQQYELAKTLAKLPKDIQSPIVHIRGELLAFHAGTPLQKKWGGLKRVLVDIRGAGWEELLEFQEMPSWKRRLKKINYKQAFLSLPFFGGVSVVSNALSKYVVERSNLDANRISIIPCLVPNEFTYAEEDRNAIRKELGVAETDRLLVFSSGGTAQWQQNTILEQIASDRWKILNLSKVEIAAPGIINRFVPYSDVYKYLAAADAAILFRSNSVVNWVACPVKFCEYLCMGLPVISNGNVELIESLIKLTSYGILVNDASAFHAIDDALFFNQQRENISAFGRNEFGIEAVAEKYQKAYQKLL